jgi:ribosomal protein S18 acetylase RimI-like enzyme
MGLGSLDLEMKALRTWFYRSGNRFSHEFCKMAVLEGESAGLLLTLRGDRLGQLENTLIHGIFAIYNPVQIVRMLWRLMVLGRTEEANRDEYLVSHIAVAPEFRRRGIATQLLDFAEAEAKEQGFQKLVLEVEINNSSAIALYEKFGFTRVLTTEFKGREAVLGCPGYYKMLKMIGGRE